MSGGSLEYIFQRVYDAAQMVEARADTPMQKAFAAHLELVGKALHNLEWVWSFDKGQGEEDPAIRACFEHGAQQTSALSEGR